MRNTFLHLIKARYPQNYIIRKPAVGALLIGLFSFIFVIVYQPLGVHPSGAFSLVASMAIYCLGAALWVFILIKILKLFSWFGNEVKWTVVKEILALIILLAGMGVAIYFFAFILEESTASRWNFSTFWDSFTRAFFIGIVPFGFFFLLNFQFLLPGQIRFVSEIEETGVHPLRQEHENEIIQIHSTLKKEKLEFSLNQFLYAESEGNYVTFYLLGEKGLFKKMIRNSISNVEWQLAYYPNCFRTHRAFIVNLQNVIKKQGNANGYKLRLKGSETEVFVSRQKVGEFDVRLKELALEIA